MTISVKENSKRISGNSFSPSGAQNKDSGAASGTLLSEVKLRLRLRLHLMFTGVKVTWAK